MRIEFGSIEIKTPYEEYLEKIGSGKNPFEAMFSKANLDFFNDIYINTPISMFNYSKKFTKVMKCILKRGSSVDTMISTYNEINKLAACYNKASAKHDSKEKLLKKVKDELVDGYE